MEPVFPASELRATFREFLRESVSMEQVDEWELTHATPRSLITRLADLGLCRFTVPTEYGGAGRQVCSTLVVVEELARCSHSLAGMYWAHVAYSGLNISAVGTPEQKQRFLPEALAGRLLFSYGLSEPDVGS